MGEPEGQSAGSMIGREASAPGSGGLIAEVYGELRRMAATYLERERPGHTLQPTALVHEAYLKLGPRLNTHCKDATHFRALVATAMRQILVDHARARHRAKRGGHALRITLDDAANVVQEPALDIIALDEAMGALAKVDARKAQVVELRFFGGMTCQEAATVLSIAPKTAEADWYLARAWLRQEMAKAAG